MKRIFGSVLLLSLLCTFALTACGEEKPAADQGPLTFRNTETSGVLTLGMTRQEAEKVLAEDPSTLAQPADWTGSGTITYYPYTADHLTIYYDKDVVAWLDAGQMEANVPSHWTIYDNLTRGSVEADVLAQYGQPLDQNQQTASDGTVHLSYYYDADGTLMGEENGSAAYVALLDVRDGTLLGYQAALTSISSVSLAEETPASAG